MERGRISCSICLDLLKEPVTLTCGHSFCKNCIKDHWDSEDEKRIYSCPQCREAFRPRPEVKKNTMLADLVEELKKTGLHGAPDEHCYAGAEDVACDVCTGRKLKALKSCLVCLASYCKEHLQPHRHSPPLKKHKLVEPSENLQENICPRHDEVMKMFCRTDQQRICYLCSVDEHEGHDTATAAAERTQKQSELERSLQEVQQRLQDRGKDVKVLRQGVEALNRSADKATEDTDEIFTEMTRLLQKRSSDVKQQIRSEQETEVSRVRDVEEKLQREIAELKKREAELKRLSLTHDHNHFLLKYRSLSALSPSTHSSTSIKVRPLRHLEDMTVAVAKLRGKLQDLLSETRVDVSLPCPQPKTRAEFLTHSQEITLDPNTVNAWMSLSEGNMKVTVVKENLSYPRHPDRFTDDYQVLSGQSVSGRCYWEVEWRGGEGVSVAVAYKNIRRSGGSSGGCGFGFNDRSWAMYCYHDSCNFGHNRVWTRVSGGLTSRIGVYLDQNAGRLSFYRVSDDTVTLLHRVHATFTQPLYAGVGFNYDLFYLPGDTAEFCQLK
ncbi:tripartite motif-containing protein 16-like [Solea solea]|uniref:tripartite motif-containing protein 16-like n=1 Tax=Solea solea TaxID=90069 RepID=UPI00272BB1F5|nr:tripartite motif-containing protein 16-like [Solea solea]